MQWLWEFYWNDAKCASDLRSTRDMIAKFSRMCNSAAREVSSKTDHLQKQWAGDLPPSWHRSWKFVQMLFEQGETGRKRTQKTNKINIHRSQTNISNKIFATGLHKTSVWPFCENFWLLPRPIKPSSWQGTDSIFPQGILQCTMYTCLKVPFGVAEHIYYWLGEKFAMPKLWSENQVYLTLKIDRGENLQFSASLEIQRTEVSWQAF